MDWTLVAVPVEDAAAVRRRVAQKGGVPPRISELLDSKQVRRTLVVDEAFADVPAWDVEDLRRLAADDKTTTKRFAEVMDLCVRLRDESGGDNVVISTRQIAARTHEDLEFEEITVEEWRAACRWIGRYLQAQYPGVPRWPAGSPYEGAPYWPLANVSGRDIGEYDELYVGITAEQAERWKSIR